MDGIFLLIFWFIINLLIKSVKDKKKIEEARRKRTQGLEKRPTYEQKNEPKGNTKAPSQVKKPKIEPKKEVVKDRKLGWEDNEWEIIKKEEVKIKEPEEVIELGENSKLQRDILRGIIFSEILSEPKSIQNSKRSM